MKRRTTTTTTTTTTTNSIITCEWKRRSEYSKRYKQTNPKGWLNIFVSIELIKSPPSSTSNMSSTSRCSLCYALLSPSSNTTNSTIGYSSSTNRRHSFHCSTSSIERLISSSKKLEKLWLKNENKKFHFRSICYRCCDTFGQIEQIQNHIEQLNHEQEMLIDKLQHHLSKRAQILRGQRQRMPQFPPLMTFNRQVILPIIGLDFSHFSFV